MTFEFAPREGDIIDVALSPDGQQVVFVASVKGVPALWLRSLATLESRRLAGTEGAARPFWSPDGKSIGFNADRKLKRIQAAGGQPLVICDWRGDGQELFFLSPTGTMMASTIKTSPDFQAGIPQALFETEITGERANHAYVVSRDGKRFLMAHRERSASTPITVVLNWPRLFE